MTKQLKENQEPLISGGDFSAAEPEESMRSICNPCDFHTPKTYKEVETDQESIGSSEETESPKSVAKVADWRKKLAYVHYQVRRIREEDLHLGEDIGEGFNAKEKINSIGGDWCDVPHNNPPPPPHSSFHNHRVGSQMNVVIFSRPILPSSPLGGKNTFRALS
ncbi:hypothetical protein Csa_001107 [Cucumis sativus]|nr:hypothetical protein Csa_001107 [Cucumis sativus]